MFYKNLWISYSGPRKRICVLIMKQDMTDLENVSIENYLDYCTKYGFNIETYKYENCRKYLNENGLFLGIIPPEIIKDDIKKWYKSQEQKKSEKERHKKEFERYGTLEPISEETFITVSKNGGSRDYILQLINMSENNCKDYNLKKKIENVHKNLLDKYFPVIIH